MAQSPEEILRAELGQPVERTVGKVRDHLHPWIQEFIRHSPFAVLARLRSETEDNADDE